MAERGNDTLSSASTGAVWLYGGDGNDLLMGGAGTMIFLTDRSLFLSVCWLAPILVKGSLALRRCIFRGSGRCYIKGNHPAPMKLSDFSKKSFDRCFCIFEVSPAKLQSSNQGLSLSATSPRGRRLGACGGTSALRNEIALHSPF